MDQGSDWSQWIITTMAAIISSAIGTVVFLARSIEKKYLGEIDELKKRLADYQTTTRFEIDEMRIATRECQDDRFKLAIRVAQLEAKNDI